jgi:hypothetical protein
MTPLVLWVPVVALGVFVVWAMVDGLVFEPRRARRRFDAVAGALHRTPVEDADGSRRVEVEVEGRTLALRSVHVGSGGSHVRGETGRLWLIETPLRVSRWEMHDIGIRQRRLDADFERRFAVRESGVPVRDGWLSAPVRQVLTDFFDSPLAIGTMRVDRGRLQHVVAWSRVSEQPSSADLRRLLERFGAVADGFDNAASRRLRMD